MKRRLLLVAGCVVAMLSSGCAMCSSEFDYDYNAYGGKYERVDRCRGRVGSAFEPAEGQLVTTPPAEAIDPGEAEPAESAPIPPADES